ncbi:MAG: tRNA pseudouridine(38-40) synthase TruA [Paludibacter sp.]|nr:tRNA pseudouridine(38-40) synthase TruA [Paludibacter sp.]
MFRYFIYLSYNGTAYCGWQAQPNGLSVQEVVTNALRTVLRSPEITIVGAGRTDTGVHAQEMVAHCDLSNKIENENILLKKLNSFLPQDIAIQKIIFVDNDVHARFGAISRTYQYHIITKKSVFKNDFAARIDIALDFEEMNRVAMLLIQYQDFTSFSKLHTNTKNNICIISYARWQKVDDDEWIFEITANRFLRNMVRAIVGTLIEVGKGKISIDDFRMIIESRNCSLAGTSAPAKGLFLSKIEY